MQEFLIKSPYISLVGSLANWQATEKDIDLLFFSRDLDYVFQLASAAITTPLGHYQAHCLPNQFDSPFTNYVMLYDLAVVPYESESKRYAPVYPNQLMHENGVTLQEVLKCLSDDILLIEDFVYSYVNSRGTIYYYVDVPRTHENIIDPTAFRICRMYEPKDREKVHFVLRADERFRPVFSLVLKRRKDAGIIEMKYPEAAKHTADRAQKTNAITPLEFFYPLKSALSAALGFRVAETFSTKAAIDLLEETAKKKGVGTEIYPCALEAKLDGARAIFFKDGKKVKIFSDNGRDITIRLPGIVEALLELPVDTICLDAEIEMYIKEKHQPREFVGGYFNSKGIPDDKDLVANVFDCLYFKGGKISRELKEEMDLFDKSRDDWKKKTVPLIRAAATEFIGGDIHKYPHVIRRKFLDFVPMEQGKIGKIPDVKKKFHRIDTQWVQTRAAAEEVMERVGKVPHHEGVMIKFFDYPYSLTKITSGWAKLKWMAEIRAIIWERIETRTRGVYNYEVAVSFDPTIRIPEKLKTEVKGKTYHKVARTYNTKRKMEIGDIIKVKFHALNHYVDPEMGFQSIHLYEPSFVELREEDSPASFDDAIRIAIEADLYHRKVMRSIAIANNGEVVRDMETVRNILKLWKEVERLGIQPFTDQNWLADKIWFGPATPTWEHKFIMALSWAHRPVEQQLKIYHRARDAYNAMKKKLHQFTKEDEAKLGFDIPWQKKFLHNMVEFLKEAKTTFEDFAEHLRKMESGQIKQILQDALDTPASKIVEVFMRDYLIVDSFPVDLNVREVLKKWEIPDDSDLILAYCKYLGIDPKVFNRAVYSLSDRLLRGIQCLSNDRDAMTMPKYIPDSDEAAAPVLKGAETEKQGDNSGELEEVPCTSYSVDEMERAAWPYHKFPDENKTYEFGAQVHTAAVSHLDLRWEFGSEDEVNGITLAIARPGMPRPESLSELHKRIKEPKWWKIDFKTGEFAKRRRRGGVITESYIFSRLKAPEPCLVEGTLVWTAEGLRKVEEIKAGDEVIDHEGKLTRVLRTFKSNGSTPLYEVKVKRSHALRVTEGHPILTANFYYDTTKCHPSAKPFSDRPIRQHNYHSPSFIQKRIQKGTLCSRLEFKLPSAIDPVVDLCVFPRISYQGEKGGSLTLQQSILDPKGRTRSRKVPYTRDFGFPLGFLLGDGSFGEKKGQALPGTLNNHGKRIEFLQDKDNFYFKIRSVGQVPRNGATVYNITTESGTFCVPNFVTLNSEWLHLDEYTVPKGSIGATANLPGYLVLIDKGTMEHGFSKPYFKELFLDGKIFKGRYIFRRFAREGLRDIPLLPPSAKQELGPGQTPILFIKTKAQNPYVLSLGATNQKVLPPKGFSALPRHLREKVPSELQYWKMDRGAALKAREELRKLWLKEDIIGCSYVDDEFEELLRQAESFYDADGDE